MNLVEYIFRATRAHGNWMHTALVCGFEQVSYAELLRRVRKFAGLLWRLEVRAGERVAIAARDSTEWVVAFLGTAAAGAVAVPVSTLATEQELAHVLTHSDACALVASADQLEKLARIEHTQTQLRHTLLIDPTTDGADAALSFQTEMAAAEEHAVTPVADDALAFLLYTSGSTGRPKGVVHLHRNLPYTVETFCRQVLRVNEDDRLFSSSRLFFAYGLGNSLSFPLSTGATSILCTERPVPAVIAEVFRRDRPTIFFAVPAVFRALLEHARQGAPLDTASLKFCVSAGEKLPAALWHEWQRTTGLEIIDGIGSTEMLHMFITNTRELLVPGSSGRAVPGYEAKLLEHAGHEIAGAGTGDLVVRGGSAFAGYWRDPEKTAATIQDDWVRTGDIYRRDEVGNYWFEGRSDDMFKVKGLWVTPVEVEEALLACPEVAEAAVVAFVNAEGLTEVAAYVVLKGEHARDEATAASINAQLTARLQSYKRPTQIHFATELPRTATGKLQRYKLRVADEQSAAASVGLRVAPEDASESP